MATNSNNLIKLIEMAHIPAGTFLMGSPDDEPESYPESYKDEKPQHSVTVPEFLMGKYPVTQAQWRAVATGLPKIKYDLDPDPSQFKGDTLPVERVNWYEAVEFCQRLSRATGRDYRLPSEAEWEYACRAGTTTPFYFGDVITLDLANYGGYRDRTTPVESFSANGFGLYDMHGNVEEWCLDRWDINYEGAPTDGTAWDKGKEQSRLLRGGSWLNHPDHCRSAVRAFYAPDIRSYDVGFRVCCSVTQKTQAKDAKGGLR